MSDDSKSEPTMEEILASIRRIISEDDVEREEDVEESEAFTPARAPEPELVEEEAQPRDEPVLVRDPEPEPEDDVLELTERVEAIGDIEPLKDERPLVSDPTAAAAAAAFGHLSASLLMPHDLRTLEDVVRELLRPLLKQWLDDHLHDIVEAQVQAEIERISRGGRLR